MAKEEPISDELKSQLFEKLIQHLENRTPYLDLFVERIIESHPEYVELLYLDNDNKPTIKSRLGAIVSMAIRDFLADAFGKIYLIYPPSDSNDKSL